MIRINNLQIYCLLILVTVPSAFLITPAIVTELVSNNSWLAILAASIPATLLILMYIYILSKSSEPFPEMLVSCLGKVVGKIVGFLYIIMFLAGAAITLGIFISFIGSSIVPDTPLSVYIGLMLLVSYFALKTGLQNIARVSELLILFGLPLSFIILLISLLHNPDFKNLMPIAYISYKTFAYGTYEGFIILSNLVAVLVLAYFSTKREKIPSTLFYVLITYIALIALTAAITIMHFGPDYTDLSTFPIFKLVRGITIGDFIQNIDAAFIALWITGIFGSISVKWFLACYFTQQVFSLRDYRFIAAPSSVALGIMALMSGKNIVQLQITLAKVVPVIYSVFYIFIPLILFLILLFKPAPSADVGTGLKTPAA
jgi:spore germination protein KB